MKQKCKEKFSATIFKQEKARPSPTIVVVFSNHQLYGFTLTLNKLNEELIT